MFTKKQENGFAEILALLERVRAIERELVLSGLPQCGELDQARSGLSAAYGFLEKLVGKERN